MISIAASHADTLEGDVDIVVGFDEEEARTFPDNSRRFVENLNLTLEDAVFEKRVKLVAPLIEMEKGEIVSLASRLEAPLELTCSCYQPRGFREDRPLHCGVCQSCLLRSHGFQAAGVPDPSAYEVEPS
jgi:7-cyano-7-deazaguanine synthase